MLLAILSFTVVTWQASAQAPALGEENPYTELTAEELTEIIMQMTRTHYQRKPYSWRIDPYGNQLPYIDSFRIWPIIEDAIKGTLRRVCAMQLRPETATVQVNLTAQDVDYAARAHLSLLIRTRA